MKGSFGEFGKCCVSRQNAVLKSSAYPPRRKLSPVINCPCTIVFPVLLYIHSSISRTVLHWQTPLIPILWNSLYSEKNSDRILCHVLVEDDPILQYPLSGRIAAYAASKSLMNYLADFFIVCLCIAHHAKVIRVGAINHAIIIEINFFLR